MWCCEDAHDELWRRQIAINRHLRLDHAGPAGRLTSRHGAASTTPCLRLPSAKPLLHRLARRTRPSRSATTRPPSSSWTTSGRSSAATKTTGTTSPRSSMASMGSAPAIVPQFAPVFVGHVSRSARVGILRQPRLGECLSDALVRRPDPAGRETRQRGTSPPMTSCTSPSARPTTAPEGLRQVDLSQRRAGARVGTAHPIGYSYHLEACDGALMRAFDILRERGIQPSDSPPAQDYLPKKIIALKLCPSPSARRKSPRP